MKLIILIISLTITTVAVSKTYKIQVFRVSDNKQLYGLYAKEKDRSKYLAKAMLLHNPPTTVLVNEDITAEIVKRETRKANFKNAKEFLKNYDCKTLDNNFLKALCRIRK